MPCDSSQGGGFVCENVWERVCPVIKSACVENKWAWLNKENCFCPLACFVFSINTVFVAAPVSLASSFAILSVQIFRRRASLAARTLRRQPSSVASAINNDNMRTLSKSADLISQPGDSVDDGCTPGFRGPAVIWSRLFFRDLTKKTKKRMNKNVGTQPFTVFLDCLGTATQTRMTMTDIPTPAETRSTSCWRWKPRSRRAPSRTQYLWDL